MGRVRTPPEERTGRYELLHASGVQSGTDRRGVVWTQNIFLIAEIDGEAAGYSKLIMDNIEPGITAKRPIELSRLYSHQKYLGQGVGQTLMDACFERSRAEDRDVMWLGVWEYNPRAQRFYERNGFRVVGSHVFLLGKDEQTDLLMQKENLIYLPSYSNNQNHCLPKRLCKIISCHR